MQKYRCHKIVEAQDLADKRCKYTLNEDGSFSVRTRDNETLVIQANKIANVATEDVEDGYLVRYSDGYISWSPRAPFEDGYAAIPPDA